MNLAHTRSQIDEAIRKAQEAQHLQAELLRHASGYDPEALQGTLGFTMEHVHRFTEHMLAYRGITLEEITHGGRVLNLRLPEDLVGRFAEFGNRQRVQVTADRRFAQRHRVAQLLDFESSFFRFLIDAAKAHDFDGFYGCVQGEAAGTLAAYKLRWQNDQGEPTGEEFLAVYREPEGTLMLNPPFLSDWLCAPAENATPLNPEPIARANVLGQIEKMAHEALSRGLTKFKHPNDAIMLAATDLKCEQ